MLGTVTFGSRIARFSTVEAEYFLVLVSIEASASAFESFKNATAFGSMTIQFAVRAAVFLNVSVSVISAEISSSMA